MVCKRCGENVNTAISTEWETHEGSFFCSNVCRNNRDIPTNLAREKKKKFKKKKSAILVVIDGYSREHIEEARNIGFDNNKEVEIVYEWSINNTSYFYKHHTSMKLVEVRYLCDVSDRKKTIIEMLLKQSRER